MTMCNRRRWQAAIIVCVAALQCRPQNEAGAEVQTQTSARLRGPLHEAFAAPLAGANQPGDIIAGTPGKPIDELPAAVKPSSPRAVWIAGYWGWDPADNDFVWIPGVWRVPPPGMRWVPGYWSEQGEGCRWVCGFWYPAKEPRLSYLPSPPAQRRERPPAPPAKAGEFQVPGYWSYKGGEYRWAAGFTAPHKHGWVWIASHGAWTPHGALFLPGYWDYALPSRGIAFAPVRLDAAARGRLGRAPVFTPSVALNVADLPEAMFLAAGLGHYYFGDYFGGESDGELQPWYEPDPFGDVDPNFAYERWQRRDQPDWKQALVDRYRERRASAALRPAVEFRDGRQLESDAPRLGVSIRLLGRSPEARWSIMQLPPEAVRQAAENSISLELLAAQRAAFEAAEQGDAKTASALDLPPPVAPLDRLRSPSPPPSATAGQYVPGVTGREVPGAANRSLPGTSGRTIPGVDVHVPGATAPGVLPGVDTGLGRK